MEHDEQADRLEREADKMEQESERVGGEIDDTRDDWESKAQDAAVPGAQPEEGLHQVSDESEDEDEDEDEEESE